MVRGLSFVAVLLASCGGSRSSSEDPHATASERVVTASDRGSTETAEPESDTRGATGPAPTLGLRATTERDGSVAITIENRGSTLARIAPRIVVERANDEGAFAALEGAPSISLRPDCTHEAVACTELAPGAALHPPAWSGSAQCERGEPIAAGTYRLVVRSCEGHRIEGDAFDVAAR